MIWNIRNEKATNQNNKKRKESKKVKIVISNLWDNFKRSNIHVIGVPEGGERKSKKVEIYLKK